MAILRIDEIRKMGREERSKKVTELKTELSRLMTTRAMGGSLENPARIRLIRKTIAKFKTINREEELGIKRSAPESQKPKEMEKAKEAEVPAEKPKKAKKSAKAPKKAKEPKAEEAEEEDD